MYFYLSGHAPGHTILCPSCSLENCMIKPTNLNGRRAVFLLLLNFYALLIFLCYTVPIRIANRWDYYIKPFYIPRSINSQQEDNLTAPFNSSQHFRLQTTFHEPLAFNLFSSTCDNRCLVQVKVPLFFDCIFHSVF